MDSLPLPLLEEILFRINLQSLAMMRCTNKSFRLHISDESFESEYFSRVRSGLLHISTFGSNYLCYHHCLNKSTPPRMKKTSMTFRILGSSSGLLLLFVDGLCVANPLTKKFRFLSNFMSNYFPDVGFSRETPVNIGFVVNKIDRTNQTFKVVCVNDYIYNTEYRFEINAGDSWRLSKTIITCNPSHLDNRRMKRPVYLNGSLHWLRRDGSILAFNPETEQAHLIPVKFPEELSTKSLFAAGDNSLTLISATEEIIYVYVLENILIDPKWVLTRRIMNGILDKKRLICWFIEAYDGKWLVLREETRRNSCYTRILHGYDLRAYRWEVLGEIPGFCDANRDFFWYTPSLSDVVVLDEKNNEKVKWGCDQRISSLTSIMSLIDGRGISSKRNLKGTQYC